MIRHFVLEVRDDDWTVFEIKQSTTIAATDLVGWGMTGRARPFNAPHAVAHAIMDRLLETETHPEGT